ncbi:conserved hypothetical protein [Ricinus communis]|uniref:RNase H type-1 domain-containing protein n=1 Tax=Ricinus communis TaxID=3988 RepID=B9SVX3_RICCO|nr:conserved hypothetical protein [Ricinus communis]
MDPLFQLILVATRLISSGVFYRAGILCLRGFQSGLVIDVQLIYIMIHGFWLLITLRLRRLDLSLKAYSLLDPIASGVFLTCCWASWYLSELLHARAMIRDDKGDCIVACCMFDLHCPSAEVGESIAIQARLQLAIDCSVICLKVESEASNVIGLIQEGSSSEIGSIISNIQSLVAMTHVCCFQAISRRCNGVAHALAKESHSLSCSPIWLEGKYFSWLRDLVLVDCYSQDESHSFSLLMFCPFRFFLVRFFNEASI